MIKRCFKCGEIKELDEFYVHPRMKDGHLNKCKQCTKKDTHNGYVLDVEKSRKKENLRYQQRKKDPKFRKMLADYGKKWRTKEKRICHNEVHRKLKRPNICELCGNTRNRIEGHHEDYSKPLEVLWVCAPCHHRITLGKNGKIL